MCIVEVPPFTRDDSGEPRCASLLALPYVVTLVSLGVLKRRSGRDRRFTDGRQDIH